MKKNKIKYFISVGLLMFVSLATYQMAKDNYVIEENEASINVDETNNLTPKELKKSSMVNLSSPLVTTELKEKAEIIGKKIESVDDEQLTSKKIAYKMMKEKQYFLSLVSHAEGYLPTVHRDNVGYALGMGWNLTKQSKEFNASIAQALYLSDNEIDKLAKVSNKNHGQINEKSYDGIKLLPHRAIQASLLIGNYIEQNVVKKVLTTFLMKKKQVDETTAQAKAEKVLESLQTHERDTITYHAYKVGPGGFSQYENLMNNLVKYSEKPTLKNKLAVASEMTYKYKDKGRIKEDIRAREIVASMFIDPSVFAESIKADKPKNYMENDMPENINHSFVKTKLFNNESKIKTKQKVKPNQKIKLNQKIRRT